MAQTNVSFEMNEKLRDKMADLCDELGMSIDDAFQLFARKMVNEQGIPFEVTEKEYPADEKKEIIIKAAQIASICALAAGVIALIASIVRLITRRR